MTYKMNAANAKLTEQEFRPLLTDPQKEPVKVISEDEKEQFRIQARERFLAMQKHGKKLTA